MGYQRSSTELYVTVTVLYATGASTLIFQNLLSITPTDEIGVYCLHTNERELFIRTTEENYDKLTAQYEAYRSIGVTHCVLKGFAFASQFVLSDIMQNYELEPDMY